MQHIIMMNYWGQGQLLHDGKYIIEEQLGSGGFGIVYRAKHVKLGEEVAIKTLRYPRNHPNYDEYIKRFQQEAEALVEMGKESHPHIVGVRDQFEEGDTLCLVMDYVRGDSLWDLVQQRLLKQQGALPEKEALEYIRQIGSALREVHDAGLIHRDVTPHNIIVYKNKIRGNQAILIDFGIAGEIVPAQTTSLHPWNSGFAPYEQAEGDREPTVDIYTLAASLYYAVTGHIPTPSSTRKDQKEELKPPQELVPQLSNEVNQAIIKGMALELENRPQSMEEWLELLSKKILRGHYKIIRQLGEGTFGETFLTEDLDIPGTPKPQRVIKRLKYSKDKKIQRRFEQEGAKLKELGEHDQIPRLFAYFKEKDEFYLVQEFIEGHTLREEIDPDKRFSETEVLELLREILEVLAFVHQKRIIHRDIKPDNIMRREQDNKLVLIDFGAVKDLSTAVATASGQIQLTTGRGTPGYEPREQYKGNPRLSSDIYAVGMVAIQALTGQSSYSLPEEPDISQLMEQYDMQLSHGLTEILDKMVRLNWEERYQDASEALQAIRVINSNQTKLKTHLPPPSSQMQESIKNYLNDFIDRYDKIDDFMRVYNQGQGQNSLSKLYIEPNLKEYQTFSKFYQQLLQNGNSPMRLVVTGDAGSGKTTFLQMIGVKYAHEYPSQASAQDWKIPVFVKLADYASKYAEDKYKASQKYNLLKYIVEVLDNQFHFRRTLQEVEQDLREGRYLLLLDALDEIGNPNIRQEVRDSITSTLSLSKGNSLVTCRSAIAQDYRITVAQEDKLLPLEQGQVINYLKTKNVQSTLGAAKIHNLEQRINSDDRTQKLLSNPLLLYMTVGYFKGVSELPSNLNVELYNKVAKHLIEQRPKERNLNSNEEHLIEESQRRQFIRSIAHHLHHKQDRNVRKGILVQVIKEVEPNLSRKEAEEYLDFLVTQIGLLQQRQTDKEDKYEFLHFTFQEFFAAEYYLEQEQHSKELLQEALNASSWWKPVIVFYYQRDNVQGEKLLEQLIAQDNKLAIGTILASDCLMEAVPEQKERKNLTSFRKLSEKLKALWQDSEYELLQKLAWTKLKELNCSKVIDVFDKELYSEQDRRHKEALKALGEIGTDQAVELIAEVARGMYLDPDEEKTHLLLPALEALLAAKTQRAKQEIKDLVEQVMETQNHQLIEPIVSPLVQTKERDYIRMFWQQLEDNNAPTPSVVTIFNAIQFEITGEMGNQMREYAKSLLNKSDKTQLKAAIRFLTRQNDTSVIDNIELLDLLDKFQEDPELQQEILKALGQLLGRQTQPDEFHEEFLQNWINDCRQSSPIITLGEFGGEKSFEYLLAKFKRDESDREIKAAILKSLYQIIKRKVIKLNPELGEGILNYLKNNPVADKELAEAAVFLLWKINSKKQVKELLQLLQPVLQQPDSIRRYLSEALFSRLLQLEKWPRSSLRADLKKWVDHCLEQEVIDPELAAEALKVKLKLDDSDSRKNTLQDSLQVKRADSICLLAIAQASQDKDFNPTDFLARLLDLLHHSDSGVVQQAIEMLGKNGNNDPERVDQVKQRLEELLYDDSYRQHAFEALWNLAK
ncbi:MAG: protein kinase [Symploca sp. SIO3E6]|nr:protein kinase [Caldora sp. SIO3E6]